MGIFSWFRAKRETQAPAVYGIPTVSFDASRVNRVVVDHIRDVIAARPEIPSQLRNAAFDAAVESVKRGRDLAFLCRALVAFDVPGLGQAQAAGIARHVHNSASSIMEMQKQIHLGIDYAKWLHSGAACFPLMAGKEDEAEAHAAANRQRYKVAEGMNILGKQTWPGRDEGCKCVSIPIVPGFD